MTALITTGAALCLQRGHILLAEQRESSAIFRRVAEAVKDIETREQENFRGTLYPHKSVVAAADLASEYGEGEDGNTFLVHEKLLPIRENVQMRFGDLHRCPEGHGACSFSGMIEIVVDGGQPIVVDVFGIGSDDANWFSVRNGMEVMHNVAAAMGQPATSGNSPSFASLKQDDFQRTIKQCWHDRHNDSLKAGRTSSPREQSLHELGSCIFLALCHEWKKK